MRDDRNATGDGETGFARHRERLVSSRRSSLSTRSGGVAARLIRWNRPRVGNSRAFIGEAFASDDVMK
jgi:hypothetical protein